MLILNFYKITVQKGKIRYDVFQKRYAQKYITLRDLNMVSIWGNISISIVTNYKISKFNYIEVLPEIKRDRYLSYRISISTVSLCFV